MLAVSVLVSNKSTINLYISLFCNRLCSIRTDLFLELLFYYYYMHFAFAHVAGVSRAYTFSQDFHVDLVWSWP